MNMDCWNVFWILNQPVHRINCPCMQYIHSPKCMYVQKSFGESTLCDDYTILVTVNLKTAPVLGY